MAYITKVRKRAKRVRKRIDKSAETCYNTITNEKQAAEGLKPRRNGVYTMNAKEIINAASTVIEDKPARSAWARGVKAYALELLDNLAELTADQLADQGR